MRKNSRCKFSLCAKSRQARRFISLVCTSFKVSRIQLTITLDGFSDQPSAQRKELLKQNWGFTCSCDLCRSSEKDLFVSDARVKKLVEGREHLASVFSNPRKVLKTVIGLLQLLDEEKLIKEKAKYCEIAMYAANQLGDEEQAKKYGECAQEEWRVMAGPDSFEVRRVGDLLKDPKKHPSWRLNPDASER